MPTEHPGIANTRFTLTSILNFICAYSLMFAVEYGHLYFVEFLLTKLSVLHVNAANAEGNTALMLAVIGGSSRLSIMKVLLEAKVDTAMYNSKKKTALHLACENQNVDQVNLLFDFNVERSEAALSLLKGSAAQVIKDRIEEEERQAQLAVERAIKEKIARERDGMVDLRNDDPTGKWILLNDKRGTGLFYYNTVSRISQRKVPLDYIPDPTKPIKDATFGMHFYHPY